MASEPIHTIVIIILGLAMVLLFGGFGGPPGGTRATIPIKIDKN